jgi:hypothetical protein
VRAFKALLVVSAAVAAARLTAADGLLAFAKKPALPSDEEQAIRLLRLSHLAYKWAPETKAVVDLTGDGVAEVVVPGASAKQLAVGIIRGPVAPLSKMFVLSWAVELVGGASCLSRMKLETEPPGLPPGLWGCTDADQSYFCRDNRELAARLAAAAAEGTRAVVFRGEGCHPVHVFWDSRTEQVGWWRDLPPRAVSTPAPSLISH